MSVRQAVQLALFILGVFLCLKLEVAGLAFMGVALLMGPDDDNNRKGDLND